VRFAHDVEFGFTLGHDATEALLVLADRYEIDPSEMVAALLAGIAIDALMLPLMQLTADVNKRKATP
jgi:hypothetical protein